MSSSVRWKIDQYYRNLERTREREKAKAQPLVTGTLMEFCEKLGFKPTTYQEKLLRDENQFIVARWSRQSGKSHIIAALILYHALRYAGSRIAILAPSHRQSRKMITRITSFLHKLPAWFLDGRALRTRLRFINESSIEALPNNPETIRGETLNMVVIDEFNYVTNDEELYDAAVYSLGTTNGRFIVASTPGSRDSMFYAMCTDEQAFEHVSQHHVSYKEALEPNGPLKREILEKIRQQTANDPWRWRREMEAEFSEDEDAWFPLGLITRCVSPELKMFGDSRVLSGKLSLVGNFFMGADLGQKQDHSAVAVVEKKDQELNLVHLEQFKLGTQYSHVLGYLKLLDGSGGVRRTYIDETGVGGMFVEEAGKSGLKNAKGVMLSLPTKQEILVYLKKVMEDGRLHIPDDRDLINEMNAERYELTKTGQKHFYNPEGTHDDRLWALALAVYASRPEIPEYHPVTLTGKIFKPWYQASTMVTATKQGVPAITNREVCLRCGKQKSPVRKCNCPP